MLIQWTHTCGAETYMSGGKGWRGARRESVNSLGGKRKGKVLKKQKDEAPMNKTKRKGMNKTSTYQNRGLVSVRRWGLSD